MENIGFFLTFCDEIGVPKTDIFQTVDLYENQNIPQVSDHLSLVWLFDSEEGSCDFFLLLGQSSVPVN